MGGCISVIGMAIWFALGNPYLLCISQARVKKSCHKDSQSCFWLRNENQFGSFFLQAFCQPFRQVRSYIRMCGLIRHYDVALSDGLIRMFGLIHNTRTRLPGLSVISEKLDTLVRAIS